jgi:ubiquinone/menaquinone biosynthesis C-methylase UbiE
MSNARNIDTKVVRDFGKEWSRSDQSKLSTAELKRWFSAYFAISPWERLPPNATGFDLGCGTGRWAKPVAPRVAELHCIEPSPVALNVARKNLAEFDNCRFHESSVDRLPLKDGSMDLGYSLGVLHHVPDTDRGIESCARKLKPGAPLLLYLYYAFDNRPLWFKHIWRASDMIRRVVSIAPDPVKYAVSQTIAALVYLPISRTARLLEKSGINVDSLPLSSYRDRSFYTMRTDALDRFGTRLEKRFTKSKIEKMLLAAGLGEIRFSERPPFWCAVAYKL